MRIAAAALLLSATLSRPGLPAGDERPFAVVVAAANPSSSITRQELARFFLRKTSRWHDGGLVTPIDQSAGSPVRRAFTRDILSVEGMGELSAVQSFWLQQVYSGRSTPPPVKGTDADILKFVASTPGAVGYVGTAYAADGIKVLTVTD